MQLEHEINDCTTHPPTLGCSHPTSQSFADAGLGDVGSAIEHELVIAPPDWERRYGLRHGAAFGLAHGLDQLSLFRSGAGAGTRASGLI